MWERGENNGRNFKVMGERKNGESHGISKYHVRRIEAKIVLQKTVS